MKHAEAPARRSAFLPLVYSAWLGGIEVAYDSGLGSNFMDAATVITTTATILISAPAAAAGVRAYRVFGGVREISCPETMEAALVRINVTRAIASRLSGGNELRLKSCSRWPGRQGCDQACLSQIAGSPDGCRVRALPTGPSIET